jgi:hypothetical protein
MEKETGGRSGVGIVVARAFVSFIEVVVALGNFDFSDRDR